MYAILDIETTGGKFNEEGMTEIAIHKFDGKKVVDKFITLVNPEIPIQPFVVQLTGINNNMLRNAPKFHEIAKQIVNITEDCILVAHNANFDYRILRLEFSRLGYNFVKDTLCTVELSRKLIPDQDSYSLGKLCKSLGIPMSDRHRANGDTIATVKLFKMLLNKDIGKEIIKANVKVEGKVKVKSNVNSHFQKLLEKAPRKTGVYYVHNKEGDILYTSKNKNIRNGVNQLLLRKSNRAKSLQKKIFDISYEETGSLLIAAIKSLQTVRENKPRFNTSTSQNIPTVVFNIENALFIDLGRNTAEKSIFLLENGQLKGYGYVELAHQITHIDIVKNLITPIEDNLFNRDQFKKYLDKGKFKKIIRFES
ncbi:exonuclease domain-containing protein [Wenyingzhuangia sp. 2_MG-2023]|uniref:exonuclease domain-containing protein n=1 Tax=Wenyingzhuangia sp. 2_MG-2023 TaxID=3062639 RepID=UPI0026E2ADBB|nr:exonuclease domain-containing protein [Wenyingzhuangia sp. 2_MG-2023]MDO6738269.1 exonuclease domain-containing protein [Wenyingzhuangia sp. 2_MG-2023]